MRTDLTAFFLGTLLVSCAGTGVELPPGHTLGEPMIAQPVETFAVLDATPELYFDRTLLVEATVTAVCVKKGCWMQIEDEGHTALVRWETGCGGKYAFPEEAVGQRVLIQGSFYPKVLSEEDAEHLQEESGGGVELERDGYELNASAVRLLE
ncbi:MAG: DUF4920 domain-containing protein [Planctomycetota bacterium]